MNRKSQTIFMSVALMASALLMAPIAAADHISHGPVDDLMHDQVYGPVNETLDATCELDPGGPDEGIVCLVVAAAGEFIYCAIPLAELAGEVVVHLVNTVLEFLFPFIKEVKCWASGAPGQTANWWNSAGYQWYRGWWCFATMGGSPGGHCQSYEGPTNPYACLEEEILACDVPALVPTPP